jgi:hypothetical protein
MYSCRLVASSYGYTSYSTAGATTMPSRWLRNVEDPAPTRRPADQWRPRLRTCIRLPLKSRRTLVMRSPSMSNDSSS